MYYKVQPNVVYYNCQLRVMYCVQRVHPTVTTVLMLAHACLARVMLATYTMLPQELVCVCI
jgi:hypothetical protein